MSVLAWIVLGLLAGFVASQIVNQRGSGILLDLVLGIIGAMVGGWLAAHWGYHAVLGLAVAGLAVGLALAWRIRPGHRAVNGRPTP